MSGVQCQIPAAAEMCFGDPASYFSVLGRIKIAGIRDLRSELLGQQEQELRFWSLGPHQHTECFILGFYEGVWQGLYLPPIHYSRFAPRYRYAPKEPEEGWARVAEEISALGVFELQDESEVAPRTSITVDGYLFFIEFQLGGRYRCYHWSNPRIDGEESERALLKIAEKLRSSFEHPDWSDDKLSEPEGLPAEFVTSWYLRRTF